MDRDRKAQAGCANASNPFHECADYCVQRSLNSNLKIKGAKSPGRNGRRNASEVNNVDPDCVNASNPFHQCAEYCTKKKQSEMGKSGTSIFSPKSSSSERRAKSALQNGDLLRDEATKLGDITSETEMHSTALTLGDLIAKEKRMEGKTNGVNRKTHGVAKVDPRCPDAVNPFHECAEYCLQKIILSGLNEGLKSDRSRGSIKSAMDSSDVDPRCPDASNPFHKCADYCFEKIREAA